jgi:hypothetical protein
LLDKTYKRVIIETGIFLCKHKMISRINFIKIIAFYLYSPTKLNNDNFSVEEVFNFDIVFSKYLNNIIILKEFKSDILNLKFSDISQLLKYLKMKINEDYRRKNFIIYNGYIVAHTEYSLIMYRFPTKQIKMNYAYKF